MSIYRRAARRDHSEKEIVQALKTLGWSVQPLSIKYAPDLLIGRQGITLLAEVKTGTKKLHPKQQEWHEAWRGFPVLVLRTPIDVVRLTVAQDRAA